MEGSCLCEGVKFRVTGMPEKLIACYCTHCAKNAGGPGQHLAKFNRDKINITRGQDLIRTYTLADTNSGSPKHKVFCGVCGCTLWTIPTHHGDAVWMIRTSLLDSGLENLLPEVELFGSRRPKALDVAFNLSSN